MSVVGWLKKDGKWKMNRVLGLTLVVLAALVSLVGCFYTPYDPNAMDATIKNASPSLAHFFGTDNFGRDVLSRVMKGAGTTFAVGLSVVTIGAVGGCLMGAFTGYFGGKVEVLISRSVWNVTGETTSPCIIAQSILSAARQISSNGMCTEVRDGLLIAEMSVLS